MQFMKFEKPTVLFVHLRCSASVLVLEDILQVTMVIGQVTVFMSESSNDSFKQFFQTHKLIQEQDRL